MHDITCNLHVESSIGVVVHLMRSFCMLRHALFLIFKIFACLIYPIANFAFCIMRSEELGDLIAFNRKKAGLTQIGLAELASVSRSVIQDLEARKGRTVWKHVEIVLRVLNIELEPIGPLVEQWLKSKKVVGE